MARAATAPDRASRCGAGGLRRGLLLDGSSAALAAALMLAGGGADPAFAQAIGPRITPNAAAQGDFTVPGPPPSPGFEHRSGTLDIIRMNRDAVLNWTTYDIAPPGGANGNSYVNFLPAGTELRFLGNGQSFTAVNRVFTAPDNAGAYRGIAFQGQVTSYLSGSGTTTVGPVGGHIWFFSPGGILATGTASFNVGSLLLSASDLQNYANTGFARTVDFTGVADPFASVILQPGARVTLGQPGSSFAVVAPTIEQAGIADVNGSVLYLSGEEGHLEFYADGSIFSSIDRDAQPGNLVRHSGTTTGPASLATDDFSVFDPQTIEFRTGRDVRVLLSGAIGYAGATDAALMPNGSIVLSAGTVETAGDLDLTSNTAIAAEMVTIEAGAGEQIAAGGDANGGYSLRVDSPRARLAAASGGVIDIAGDVTLESPFRVGALELSAEGASANGPGGRILVGGALVLDASMGRFNAVSQQGGTVQGAIGDGGSVAVGGSMLLLADAYATQDASGVTSARGGSVVLTMTGAGASLAVGQELRLSASALPFFQGCQCILPGPGSARGGIATLTADAGMLTAGSLSVAAGAQAFDGFSSQIGGADRSAVGGTALVALADTVTRLSSVSVTADASGARGSAGIDGGGAQGGTASFAKGAGGSLAVASIDVSANAAGGLGSGAAGSAQGATRGGDARGGAASISLAQNAAGLSNLGLSAAAAGGGGGSGLLVSGASGGAGGDATGGSAALTLAGSGTSVAGVVGGGLDVSAQGGQGGEGEADFANAVQGGAGGAGGSGRGGSLTVLVRDGAQFTWNQAIGLVGRGDTGGKGGDQTSVGGSTSVPGPGGRGGDGFGGAVSITADGGLIAGDLDLDARGEAGAGGLDGADLAGQFTGAADPGLTTGGSIALTATNAGGSRFNVADAVLQAGGDTSGRIAIADQTTGSGAGMSFGTLYADAAGAVAGPLPSVRLSAVGNAVTVTGTAEMYGVSIALDFSGAGRLAVGGSSLLSTTAGDVSITHAGNPGLVSLQTGGPLVIAARGNYAAGGDAVVASDSDLSIRATGSILAADSRSLGSVLMIAQGDASLGDLAAAGDLQLFAGREDSDGFYGFLPTGRATITGTIATGGSAFIEAGGFAEFASGSALRSDNAIRVRTGDDIILAAGASLVSGLNPVGDASIALLAGDIVPGPLSGDLLAPITTPISSLVLRGALDTNGAALTLTGDAIDGTGSMIAAGDLAADVTDPPLAGPFSDDGGLLAAGCLQGSICLGAITASGDVAIGLDSGAGLVSLAIGSLDFSGGRFEARTRERLALGTGDLDAGALISLASVFGAVELGAITMQAPSLSLRAGGDLAAAQATLLSPNAIAIAVGGDINVGAINAGAGLQDGSGTGLFSTPGDFIVGSLTYGAGTPMRIRAGGDLSLGFADPSGGAIELAAANALFLGASAAGSGPIRLEGASVGFDNLRSTGLVQVIAVAGGIDGVPASGLAIDTPGRIALASLGGIAVGGLNAGGDIGLDATGAVTASSAAAGGQVSLAGSSVALNSASFGAGLTLTARSGGLTGSGLYQGVGPATLRAAQDIAIGSLDTLGAVSLDAGGGARFAELRSRDGSLAVNAAGAIVGASVAASGLDAAGDDSVTLTAGGAITLDPGNGAINPLSRAQDDFIARAGGALSITQAEAGRDVVLAGASVFVGGVGSSGGTGQGIGAQAITGGGAVTVTATNAITVFDRLTAGGSLSMTAGGLVTLTGLASGQTIALRAGDLAIGSAGLLGGAGTQRISLASTNAVNLGGGASGGFAVDAAEFGRIQSSGDLMVTALAGTGTGAGSLAVGALTINAGSGGQIGSSGSFGLTASGLLDVDDTLAITRAGPGTTLLLTGDVVDLDYASARLAVLDPSNAATGRIIVNGRLITSMSAAAAAEIAGKSASEITQRLGRAEVVRDVPLFRAGSLTLEGREAILVQNSGAAAISGRRGLSAGAVTLIGASDGRTLVVANGVIGAATGIEAARAVTLNTSLLAGSTFNGCLLANISSCIAIAREPPLPDSLLFGVIDLIRKEHEGEGEGEEGQAEGGPETPVIDSSQIDDPAGLPMIDDPVTGTGNEDLWQPPEG